MESALEYLKIKLHSLNKLKAELYAEFIALLPYKVGDRGILSGYVHTGKCVEVVDVQFIGLGIHDEPKYTTKCRLVLR